LAGKNRYFPYKSPLKSGRLITVQKLWGTVNIPDSSSDTTLIRYRVYPFWYDGHGFAFACYNKSCYFVAKDCNNATFVLSPQID